MEKLVALVVSGLVSGAFYSLIAAGLVLIYSTTRTFNFGHGAIAFVSAVLFFELNTGLGVPLVLAAVLTILVFAPLLGLGAERVVFRPLSRAGDTARIVASVGLMVALPALALWIVQLLLDHTSVSVVTTENVVGVPGLGPSPATSWNLGGGITIDSTQVSILVLAALCSVLLWVLLEHSRLGLQMRAAVDRWQLAELRGIDTGRVSRITWALSFALAGVVGVAGAPILNFGQDAYTLLVFVGATAAVLGGFRSIPLALAGGLALGVIQNLVAGYASFASNITGLSTSVPFLFLFVGLFLLKSERSRSAGQAAEGGATERIVRRRGWWRTLLPLAAAWGGGAVLIYMLDDYWVGFAALGLAYAIVLLSLVVVTGIGGMVSLAQAAFVTLGAMLTGLLISNGVPYAAAMAMAIAGATLAGLVVALPALRLGGLNLALATLALALLCDGVLFQWTALANDEQGWIIPRIGGDQFVDDRSYALLLLALAAVLALAINGLKRSRTGRAISAVRSSPTAASAVGLSVVRSRFVVFGISAAIAGFGGILLAGVSQSITSIDYPTATGLLWLLVIVMFGVTRVEGALVGGLALGFGPPLIDQITDSALIPSILFGLGAIQVASTPDGVLAIFPQMANAIRRGMARLVDRGGTRASTQGDGGGEPGAVVSMDAPVQRDAHAAAPAPADGDSERALRLEGIRAGYGDVEVLHGVDLDVRPGAITVLLGLNGAGKSTLCSVAAGLNRQTGGRVLLDGRNVSGLDANRRARLGLFTLPESRGIFPSLSVLDNLALTLGPKTALDRVFEAFPQLHERRDVLAGSLSGGEQQMLTLAPVMVERPRVVVADEPLLGLARSIVHQIVGVFVRLRDEGTAVLLVDEKPRLVVDVADSMAILERGQIAWRGPAADFEAGHVASAYMSPSTTGELAQAQGAAG